MRAALAVLAFLLVAASAIHAQDAYAWNWSNYTGTTNWKVTYTEDDSKCADGGTYTFNDQVTITHKGAAASFDDEHGPVTGTFLSGNILHVPGRTVRPGDGTTSKISAYDLFFTTDCLSFAGSYSWDYSDQYGFGCKGTTRMAGTNLDNECPAGGAPIIPPEEEPTSPPVTVTSQQSMDQKVATAHADLKYYLSEKESLGYTSEEQLLLKAKVTGSLEGILQTDPGNPQANFDMAELKRSDGNEEEYKKYMDAAMDSIKNGRADTRKTIDDAKTSVAGQLGLGKNPDPYSSYFMKRMHDEIDGWQGDLYGSDPKKDSADKQTWTVRVFGTLASLSDAVDNMVFK